MQTQTDEIPTSTTFAELDHHLTLQTAENKFSGVVLVAHDGDPLFHQAYGPASKRFRVPNRVDTKFNLGSINKIFTIVAVLQLAERGSLALAGPADVGRLYGLHQRYAPRI